MAVEAIIHHWVTVVVKMEVGAEGLGISIQDLAAYFYVDDGLVVSTRLKRLQMVFDVLADLFNRVGLRKNTQNTVSIVYQK